MLNAMNSGLRKIPAWTIYIVGAGWAGWLFYGALTGALGPEPINALEREYGALALKLLIAGLVVTPLRNHVGLNLIKFRRAIGLTAFFYVVLHLSVWLLLDVQALAQVWTEIVKRPYITIGMVGFVALIPLAVTSNNRSLRKLGPLRWRKLHKLTYLAVILGGVHFLMLVKGWQWEPILYLATILLLLATRILPTWGGQKPAKRIRTVKSVESTQ